MAYRKSPAKINNNAYKYLDITNQTEYSSRRDYVSSNALMDNDVPVSRCHEFDLSSRSFYNFLDTSTTIDDILSELNCDNDVCPAPSSEFDFTLRVSALHLIHLSDNYGFQSL